MPEPEYPAAHASVLDTVVTYCSELKVPGLELATCDQVVPFQCSTSVGQVLDEQVPAQ